MRFTPTTRLGPYEIVAFLGAGGMGEVYRARDTRLDRSVAIKVLPREAAGDLESRQRLDREARAISALNHPHICSLFDIGHQDDVDFLVMEYLEGETLATRLGRGPLPVEQVLRYSIEIAGALDKAHRQGVVHRDLKPGNIMLTPSGAKLLDFGLAKLQPVISTGASNLSTNRLTDMTRAGVIVGTLHYMAPEQIEGLAITSRADIFSFGVVMYEMATGTRPFAGQSPASIIAAVLASTPARVTDLQSGIPPGLERVIATCLEKDPDDRWQTARDLQRELRWISEASQSAVPAAPAPMQRKARIGVAIAVATAAALIAVGAFGAAQYFRRPAPIALPIRFTVSAPENMSIGRRTPGPSAFEGNAPVLSPDGRQLAFVATDAAGRAQLFVRALDAPEPRLIEGTDGAARPFWSPDGQFLAFFADGKLKKIDASGGRAQTLADAPGAAGGTWNAAGVILFAPGTRDGLYAVSDTGGKSRAITTPDPARREGGHILPSFLPDGEHFLFLVLGFDPQASGIHVGSLAGEAPVLLLNDRAKAVYAEPGYLLYVRDGTLFAHPFDANIRQLTGMPRPVVGAVVPGAFTAADTGVLAFHPMRDSTSQLVWHDRNGNELGRVSHLIDDHPIALSPDGRRVAVIRDDPETGSAKQDIWLIDLTRDVISRLTAHPADDCCPAWSANGREIVFSSDRDGPMAVYRASAAVQGGERLLFRGPGTVGVSTKNWSADGTLVLLGMNDDLWLLPVAPEGEPRPVVQGPGIQSDGKFSPDGKWLAYSSNESGRVDVYLSSVSAPGERWPLSSSGGYQPRWSRDGREIYYVSADSRLMAVSVKTDDGVEVGRPEQLFRSRLAFPIDVPFTTRYDVAPDGRFLLNVPVRREPPLTVLLNWQAQLREAQ